MKKIAVIAHESLVEEVVETLTREGTVHVAGVEGLEILEPRELSHEETERSRALSFGVAQVDFILGFIQQHSGEKRSFMSGLIKPKHHLTMDEFMRTERKTNLSMLYAECQEYERRLFATRDDLAALERERDELADWTEYEIPLSEFKGGLAYRLMAFRLSARELPALLSSLEAEAPESEIVVAGERGALVDCLMFYHPSIEDRVMSILGGHKIEEISLPDIPLEPLERVEQIDRDIAALEHRRDEVLARVKGYLKEIPTLEVLKEYLVNRRAMIEVTRSFGMTERTVVIDGWVREEDANRTLETLARDYDQLDAVVHDGADGEDSPVSLKNPRWARPFELLIGLFGSPNRREYDPTVVVAISFSIFFGFCMGDVGYGILLIPTFLLMRKYLPLGPKAKALITALTYGSAMAIPIGILTGSWFGIPTSNLPHVLRSMAVLDPLNETLLVMGVSIGIGVVHLLAGTGIELRDNWRAGNRADALIDQGLVFFLFVGGGAALALAVTKVVPVSVFLMVFGAGVLLMLCLLGRSAESIAGKAVNGLYETYGTVVGFISDSISYVRLFALGLATYMIAFVINRMAGMVGGMAPVIGILLAVLVLIVGHTFNIAINLLGAFVHPLRLEYVEFFGKFYEGGGRAFDPLGIKSKIVIIREREGA